MNRPAVALPETSLLTFHRCQGATKVRRRFNEAALTALYVKNGKARRRSAGPTTEVCRVVAVGCRGRLEPPGSDRPVLEAG